MTAVVAFIAGAALVALTVWIANREPGTDWLADVSPIVAPAEPVPPWLPTVGERRRHWVIGTEAYDIENVIRRTWDE